MNSILLWLANNDVSMCTSPYKNIAYNFVLTSAAMSNPKRFEKKLDGK